MALIGTVMAAKRLVQHHTAPQPNAQMASAEVGYAATVALRGYAGIADEPWHPDGGGQPLPIRDVRAERPELRLCVCAVEAYICVDGHTHTHTHTPQRKKQNK